MNPRPLSTIIAQRLPNNDKDKHEEEYAVLLALFRDVIKSIRDNDGQWESLEELMKARADFAVRHAFDGFGISYDDAFQLLKNADDLSDEQRVQRDILVAAVDNLVDFAVAEEYHLAEEVLEYDELEELEEDSEEYADLLEILFGICHKYNNRYAYVENMDIEYAMIVAAFLSSLKDDTILTYMTMGDERVRPWHLQYEGYSAPRSQFPSWLIPPIEHQCRCFLVEDTKSTLVADIQAAKKPQMPDWFDRTFKESVANGGRIFSDEHSYFQIDKKHVKRLGEISDRIKAKYFGDGSDSD